MTCRTNPLESAARPRRAPSRLAIICTCLPLVAAAWLSAAGKKRLTVENVMDLLSGGVALPRIVHLVGERGVDFQLSPQLEQAVQDAGGDQQLISALSQQSGGPASRAVAESESPVPKEESAPPAFEAKPAPKSGPPPAPGPTAVDLAGTAGLRITSRPSEVSIFVDDELKGTTTGEEGLLEIGSLKPGRHRVRASRAGYETVEAVVELGNGQVLETPIWLTKVAEPAPAAPATPSLPPGKKFLVRHVHRAFPGLADGGYCQGWMIINIGYIRYISSDGSHKYLMNTSEMKGAKAGSGQGNFRIKLDFGREYQFAAVNEQGAAVAAGPILAEIRYSMGE